MNCKGFSVSDYIAFFKGDLCNPQQIKIVIMQNSSLSLHRSIYLIIEIHGTLTFKNGSCISPTDSFIFAFKWRGKKNQISYINFNLFKRKRDKYSAGKKITPPTQKYRSGALSFQFIS